MNRTLLNAVCAAAALASCGAYAAPLAMVEAVQAPAWVQRDGSRIPLAAGMELRDRDEIRTGEKSKVLLRMGEGSSVKLGENARFALDSVQIRKDKVFAAAMRMAEGAFRFTTRALARYRVKRDININIAQVTAGIRGTDVWGKAAADRDIVCLIEGKVEVQRGTDKPFTMDQPLSFYIAPRDKPPLPVAPVPPEQLRQWSAETEIEPGKGATRAGGKWKVVLASEATQQAALAMYDKVRAAGYAAQILPTRINDKPVYLVRLSQLPSKAEASALADALRGRIGAIEPMVTR